MALHAHDAPPTFATNQIGRAMPRAIDIDAIEDLADREGPQVALLQLGAPEPDEGPAISLLRGALLARSGDLDGALKALAGPCEGSSPIAYEAQVTRASVWAAQGRYQQAVPALRAAVAGLRTSGGPAWLLHDAEAELAAYETLLG